MISFNRQCTACGGCVQTCPRECIKMVSDQYGFNYPQVDETSCIKCNLCEKVCPIDKTKDGDKFKQIAFAAINTDNDELLRSTSGGAFGALAKYILSLKGVVYGCAWNNRLKAEHIRVSTFDDLKRLNGSKYVQSNTLKTFKEARQDLENNRWVLYSGTPCQIDALKRFLGKSYDRLVTVDIICHGVPSQKLLDGFVKGLEDSLNVDINNIDFRAKENNKWGLAGTYAGTYRDSNALFKKKFFYFESYYYFYFLKGYIYRESCYSCRYANLNRQGDFTLGDLWGSEAFRLPFSTENGCSLVIVNSEKAKNIIDKINLKKVEINLEQAAKYNRQLSEPVKRYPDRLNLLDSITKNSFLYNNKFFKRKFKKDLLFSRFKYAVPDYLKKIIKIIRYRYLVEKG